MTTETEFQNWLDKVEDLDLEFKQAENSFDVDHKLHDYCAAIANRNGGKLVLGVNDKTHEVTGTKAFDGTWNTLPHKLQQNLGIQVDAEEFFFKGKRTIIFHIPKRALGRPIKSNGKYLMRAGESLVEMDEQTLKSIFGEVETDYSAEVVGNLQMSDLDETAMEIFKQRWIIKSQKEELKPLTHQEILEATGLMEDRKVTRAALILLGKEAAIRKYLACDEIIFEWRQSDKVEHDFRVEWRGAFFLVFDEIWKKINDRNIRFPFQEGLMQREIWAFNEKAIREALLNAVCHRDYKLTGGSIFIKASPKVFSIVSPGGFPIGVTPTNALTKQVSRNRLLAETFQRVGFVERAGQGLDDIFRYSIEEGKGLPNFEGTDGYQVVCNIPATLQDESFVKFLEKVVNEKQTTISLNELLELEKIRLSGGEKNLSYKERLLELGVVEKVGRGRGTTYILSRKYYEYAQKVGLHTKLKGLEREQKKQLILNHLKKEGKGYSKDIQEALELKQSDVNNLLQELKRDHLVKRMGNRNSGHWELY